MLINHFIQFFIIVFYFPQLCDICLASGFFAIFSRAILLIAVLYRIRYNRDTSKGGISLMHLKASFGERLQASLLDDTERYTFLLLTAYAVLSLISGIMTVANILTHKGILTTATLSYSLLCALVFDLLIRKRISLRLAQAVFVTSIFALLTFFIVSGIPDGFSILWVCMLPACGLLALGCKTGSILSLVMLLELLFFFHVPFGQSLMQYDYNDTFVMRFPLLYTAFLGASMVLERIRELTHRKLIEVQARYRCLYTHDALTEVYNRYGFNELMDRYFLKKQTNLGLIILDIDFFKRINDEYGHTQGDLVLQRVARVIVESAGATANVCRWGGEEFAVLIPNCADLSAAAEALSREIRACRIPLAQSEVSVTASIGAVLAKDTATCAAAQLVSSADACLYHAKMNGRDRVECEVL